MSTRIFKKQETTAAVVPNILTGTDFEYPTGMSKVVIASAGANAVGRMSVKFGSRVIAEDLVISQEIGTGQGPRIPENLMVNAVVMPTERIQISIDNSAGTADPTTYVEVTPL